MALQIFKTARAVRESSRGAGGTPTRILSFVDGSWTQDVATIAPDEFRGSYFSRYNAEAGTETNSLSLSGDLTFSQAAWLGYVYVHGTPTLGTPVAGTAYSYSFTPASTADTLSTVAVEYGYVDTASSTAAARLSYVGGNELTLAWDKSASRISFDASFLSASTATKIAAFTGTPTAPTTALLSTSNTNVYIDSTTIGSTADQNVVSVSWTLSNDWQALYTLNGTRAAQNVFRPNPRKWTATVVRYYANTTEQAAFESKTPRKIRVRTTGPSTLAGGSAVVTLDLYGVITSRSVAETDGIALESLELQNIYDTTATTDFTYSVTTSDASIT